MKKILLAVLAVGILSVPADAASLSKTYSYFSVGGKTLAEIETEVDRRGPRVRSTGGRRHPGATQMEFTTRIAYAAGNGGCAIAEGIGEAFRPRLSSHAGVSARRRTGTQGSSGTRSRPTSSGTRKPMR